jgi:hypothetical protein
MLSIGFGDEQNSEIMEMLAQKMQALLEEHGWYSSYGRDPVLLLIEREELSKLEPGEDNA